MSAPAIAVPMEPPRAAIYTPTRLDVVAAGLCCSVGLRLPAAAAAIAAGINRFRESSFFDRRGQPIVMALVPDDKIPGLNRPDGLEPLEARVVGLAERALREVWEARPGLPPLPTVLALAEPHPRVGPLLREAHVLRALAARVPGAIELRYARTLTLGRPGGILALRVAAEVLERVDAPAALVIAADSYAHAELLAALDREDRIRADGVYDGFTPGEAGSCVMVTRGGEAAGGGGGGVLAEIQGVASAEEPGHRYSELPHRGDGLAAAIRALLEPYDPTEVKIGTVMAGLNGESLLVKEWSVARVRCSEWLEGTRVEHWADCLGDTGGAILGVMDFCAIQRNQMAQDAFGIAVTPNDCGEVGAVMWLARGRTPGTMVNKRRPRQSR